MKTCITTLALGLLFMPTAKAENKCVSSWVSTENQEVLAAKKLVKLDASKKKLIVNDFKGDKIKEIDLGFEVDSISSFYVGNNSPLLFVRSGDLTKVVSIESGKVINPEGINYNSNMLYAMGENGLVLQLKNDKMGLIINSDGHKIETDAGWNLTNSNSGAVITKKDKNIQMIDIKTGEKATIEVKDNQYSLRGRAVKVGSKNFIFIDGKWRPGPTEFGEIIHARSSGEGVFAKDNFIYTVDLKSNKVISKNEGNLLGANDNEARIIENKSIVIYDNNKKGKLREGVRPENFRTNITNAGWTLISDKNNQLSLENAYSGKIIKAPKEFGNGNYGQLSELSEGVFELNAWSNSGTNSYKYIFDSKSGNVKVLSTAVTVDKNLDLVKYDGQINKPKEICFPRDLQLEDCQCDEILKNKDALDSVKQVALVALCQGDGKGNWDQITGPEPTDTLSNSQAQLYIYKFQKYNQFNPQKDMRVLSAIMGSSIVEQSPDQIYPMLQAIQGSHPYIVKSLYKAFDLEKRLKVNKNKNNFTCTGEAEKNNINKMKDELIKLANSSTDNSYYGRVYWDKFRVYANELAKLDKSTRNQIQEGISEHLLNQLDRDPRFKDVPNQTNYYLMQKYVRSLFGDQSKEATDVVVTGNDGTYKAMVLSNGKEVLPKNWIGPADDASSVVKVELEKPVDPKRPEDLKWSIGNEVYTAKIESKKIESLDKLYPKSASLPYQKMGNGKENNQLIFLGENLRHDQDGGKPLVDSLIKKYQSYYKDEGFTFNPQKIVETEAFMGEKIKSGEIGLLAKEAHSDGDEKNLAKVPQKSILIEGIKGKEKVYLLFPTEEHKESKALSSAKIAEWISSRPKDSYMVYINGSCNSSSKAVAETLRVSDKRFINLGSDTMVDTFENEKTSPMRIMIDGIRKKQTYASMHKALKDSPDSRTGDNNFLFPDSEDYENIIRKKIRKNYRFEKTIYDSKGREVNFADMVDDENAPHD